MQSGKSSKCVIATGAVVCIVQVKEGSILLDTIVKKKLFLFCFSMSLSFKGFIFNVWWCYCRSWISAGHTAEFTTES